LETLARATGSAAFATVSGNIYRLPKDTLAYPSYTVVLRQGVRIGITGFTTPGVMMWDRHLLGGRVRVWPVVSAAEGVLLDLDPRVDLKIVLVHSGMDGPSSYDTTGVGAEDVAAGLARLLVKPD